MRATVVLVILLEGVWAGPAAAQIVEGGSDAARAAIARSLALVPRRPTRIIVADRATARRLRPSLSRAAEAFVPIASTTVHLIEQGDTLQHAIAQGGIFDYALAVVIWHELAHAEGADEREAQLREEELWQRFIVEGHVDRARGLAYLALLRHRRD